MPRHKRTLTGRRERNKNRERYLAKKMSGSTTNLKLTSKSTNFQEHYLEESDSVLQQKLTKHEKEHEKNTERKRRSRQNEEYRRRERQMNAQYKREKRQLIKQINQEVEENQLTREEVRREKHRERMREMRKNKNYRDRERQRNAEYQRRKRCINKLYQEDDDPSFPVYEYREDILNKVLTDENNSENFHSKTIKFTNSFVISEIFTQELLTDD